MNKDVIVISEKEENIKKLKTIFNLAGYNLYLSNDLNNAFNMIEKFLPLALIIVEEDEIKAEIYIKEIRRYLPLIPVIIMLNTKDHLKRERYLSYGIYDVIEQPWTEITLATILNSIETKNIHNIDTKKKITKKIYKDIFYLSVTLILIIILFSITKILYIQKQENTKTTQLEATVPSVSISGFFEKNGYIYIYDWAIQSFYVINYRTSTLENIKYFFTPYIITSIKDSGTNSFFAITDTKDIKRFIKDDKIIELSSIRYEDVKDICFDGMYIWILENEFITKALNNDTLSIIEKFNLPQQLIKSEHITCNQNTIIYYTDSKAFISEIEKPTIITKSINIHYKMSSVNIINNRIIFITPMKNKSYIKELIIK